VRTVCEVILVGCEVARRSLPAIAQGEVGRHILWSQRLYNAQARKGHRREHLLRKQNGGALSSPFSFSSLDSRL